MMTRRSPRVTLLIITALLIVGCKERDLEVAGRMQGRLIAAEVRQHARAVAARLAQRVDPRCGAVPWRARSRATPDATLEGTLRAWLGGELGVAEPGPPDLEHVFTLRYNARGDLALREENTTRERRVDRPARRARTLLHVHDRGWFVSEDGVLPLAVTGEDFDPIASQTIREAAESFDRLLDLLGPLAFDPETRELLAPPPQDLATIDCAARDDARRVWLDALDEALELVEARVQIIHMSDGSELRRINARWRRRDDPRDGLRLEFSDRFTPGEPAPIRLPSETLSDRRDTGYRIDRALLRDALMRHIFPGLERRAP